MSNHTSHPKSQHVRIINTWDIPWVWDCNFCMQDWVLKWIYILCDILEWHSTKRHKNVTNRRHAKCYTIYGLMYQYITVSITWVPGLGEQPLYNVHRYFNVFLVTFIKILTTSPFLIAFICRMYYMKCVIMYMTMQYNYNIYCILL